MKQAIDKFDENVLHHSRKLVADIESLPPEERQTLAWIIVMALLLVGTIIKGMRLL